MHPQALAPGTSPLGLHKGEPYYPRAGLSVLHTVERWRREGRQVRTRAPHPPPPRARLPGSGWARGSRLCVDLYSERT